MKKRLLASLLVASMALGLVACGSSASSAPAAAESETTEEVAEEATEEAEAPAAEATGSSAPDWTAYDELINQIGSETDLAKRVDLMHEAEDMLMDSWAVLPLYYYNNSYMLKDGITGIYSTVSGRIFFHKASKETMNVCLSSEPDYLDPQLTTSSDGGNLAAAAFAGLYTYGEDGSIVPAVADGMPEVSEDGTVYTIKMQETLWSNGDALTANDFIYSWNRAVDPATAVDYAYLFDLIARNDDGSLALEAIDDYTLQVTLASPCPYFQSLLAFATFFPVHQASVEAANPDGTVPGKWAQEPGFVCNGAYTLTAWSHNESMTYEANPNYYDAANVTCKTLNFMLSADDTAIYAAYNAGDLDYINSVPNDEIPSLLGVNPEFHVVDYMGTYYIGFNVNSDLFDGMTVEQAKAFRHAISCLIDRQYIVDACAQQGQVPADSFIPVGMSDSNGSEFKGSTSYYSIDPDVEQAVELLAEAGYTVDVNAGTIEPAVSMVYLTNDTSGHIKIAESIQQDLAAVGIELTIQSEDWNVFLEDRKVGNFTLAREGWIADYDDPVNMLEIFRSDSGNNDMQLGK